MQTGICLGIGAMVRAMSRTDEESMKREVEDLLDLGIAIKIGAGRARPVFTCALPWQRARVSMTPENHSLAPIGLGWLSHRLV